MPSKAQQRLTAADRLAIRQSEAEQEERRDAARALLATPLLPAEGHHADAFQLVRRHADWLKGWFQRWPGWPLVIAADVARLRKHPSPRKDTTRGLLDKASSSVRTKFSRRRYALLCLVIATLENEQRQTTIQQVASKTQVAVRIDSELRELGFEFDPRILAHRRELVAVMRFLQRMHVLLRADGDDSGYVRGDGDCLYRIERAALTTILCSIRGASTVAADRPIDLIQQLNDVETPESPEAQNRELQHRLVRRLLDDPVMYYDELTAREYEYFNSQGERILGELTRVTGMIAERRAEGAALLDPTGGWTDLGLPESGTRGHATLLLAEWFGEKLRHHDQVECRVALEEVQQQVASLATKHESHWRKNANTPEGIHEIMHDAIDALHSLGLLEIAGDEVIPRAAIARYCLGNPCHETTSPSDQ